MRLAVAGTDAVRILRALRCSGVDARTLPRGPLCAPDPAPCQRLRANRLDLATLRLAEPPSAERQLCVAVPAREQSLRAAFARSVVVRPEDVPASSFVEVGGGIQIPCPELLFVQMGAFMLPAIHLAFGMELCGGFSRDAAHPIEGASTFGIAPATTREKLAAYVASCKNVTGIAQARRLAPLVCDNAWSPMEASTAALLSLSWFDYGYGAGPIELNRRVPASGTLAHERASRVPDILFAGSRVGFNYDGAGHLDLERVARAAAQAACAPEDPQAAREAERVMRDVRATYVDDRRRDRELWAQGYEVMPVMAEDLAEEGGLDGLVAWALDRLEAEGPAAVGRRDLATCRKALRQGVIARMRQQLVWSMLPGARGREARARIAREYEPRHISPSQVVTVAYRLDELAW